MKGKLIHDKYQILRILGKNEFSTTFLAKEKGNYNLQRYAIKKFRPILGNPQANITKRLFQQEANILQRLNSHPQIPQLYESFMDGEDLYLVREWIEGITLEQKVKSQGVLSESETKNILDSILRVLKYIHGYGIVYRQLKPSSILLRQRNWRQPLQKQDNLPIPIYFGGVKELEKTERLSLVGTAPALYREYIPPEQIRGKSSYASDVYSLGLTAIYLLTGKTPKELEIGMGGKVLWRQATNEFNTNLARVIDRAIYADPRDRFTSAETMLQALHSQPVLFSNAIVEPIIAKPLVNSEVKVSLTLLTVGFSILGIAWGFLNFDWDNLSRSNEQKEKEAMEKRAEQVPEKMPKKMADYQERPQNQPRKASKSVPNFPVGTSKQEIFGSLGEPTMLGKGYWGMSQAFSYLDHAPERFALGYLTDNNTELVRQSEITFTPSANLRTIQQAVEQLLLDEYTPEIEHQIMQIYYRSAYAHEFEGNSLQGIIQRNSQDGIYFGVWDKDFH